MAIETVLDEALKLPVEERAELIERLLDSLAEDEPDAERDAAWTDVIERRVREVREGRAVLVDRHEAMARVREAVATAAARRR